MYIFIIIVLYFLPTISAYERKKKNSSSILVVNLFLGWTIIGWIVALSWALAKDTDPVVIVKPDEHTKADKNVSNELTELFKLKEKGAITEEEFKVQKAKLLG